VTKACQHAVEGKLGTYCPIAISQSDLSPICEGNEHASGATCRAWELAQKAAGRSLPKPNTQGKLQLNCPPLVGIDFLLEQGDILAVEDNPVSMKVLEKSLSGLKRELIKTTNGQEALNAINSNPKISLILLDLDMPVMNGYDFVDALNEIYEGQFPFAILIVSEMNDWKKAKSMIDKGITSHIKKPYNAKDLQQKIFESLKNFKQGN
jgi:CheY-like chemotaxis protein